MTELINRFHFIDPSFNPSITDEKECIATFDSFSTTIALKKENKVIALEIFDHKTKNIASFIEEDFRLFDLFSDNYQRTTLCFSSQKETLIPTTVFDRSYIEDYIKFNFQSIDNEVVLYDDIKELGIIHVYTINRALLNTLNKIMPNAVIKNQKSVLIEKFYQHNGKMCNMYVNTKQGSFDGVAFNEKGLLFANTFYYNSANDYIYYLMNIIKQLKLNPETLNLFLSGEIGKEDAIYNLIYKYIRNISFIQKPDEIELPLEITPYHYYLTIF